jgi:hypothetical protein
MVPMPLPCGAAKDDTPGAKARETATEIARIVRMMLKSGRASKLSTLSFETDECVLRAYIDASFFFRQQGNATFRNDA